MDVYVWGISERGFFPRARQWATQLALCRCQVPGCLINSDMVGVEVRPNLPDLPEKKMYQLY